MSDTENNKAATALGKLRWAGSTEKQRKAFASAGGNARKAALSPERRTEIARKAALAKAKKAALLKKSAKRKSQ